MNAFPNQVSGRSSFAIVQGATSALAMRLFGIGCGYVFALIVARTAGAEAWGTFTLSWSVATFGVVVGRLGVDTALLRFTASTGAAAGNPRSAPLIRSAYLIVLTTATVAMITTIVLAGEIAAAAFGKPELSGPIRLIAATILPASLLAVGAQILRGFGRISAYVFYQNVGRNLAALALVPVALAFFDVDTAFLWAFAAGYFVLASVGSIHAMLAVRALSTPAAEHPGETVGALTLLKIGSSMTVATVVLYFRATIGLLVVGALMPIHDVGIFHIALRLAALVTIPLFGVSTVVTPRFAESHRIADVGAIEETIRIAGVVIALAAVPAALVLLTVPARILAIFGPEFVAAATPLRWLVVGQTVNALAGPIGQLLLMTGREVAYRNVTVGVVSATASLYWLLVPELGLTGAAIADCLGLLLWNGFLLAYVRLRFGIWPLPRAADFLNVRTWVRELFRPAQAT